MKWDPTTEHRTEKTSSGRSRMNLDDAVKEALLQEGVRTGVVLMEHSLRKQSQLLLDLAAQFDWDTPETVAHMLSVFMETETLSRNMYHLAMTLTSIYED